MGLARLLPNPWVWPCYCQTRQNQLGFAWAAQTLLHVHIGHRNCRKMQIVPFSTVCTHSALCTHPTCATINCTLHSALTPPRDSQVVPASPAVWVFGAFANALTALTNCCLYVCATRPTLVRHLRGRFSVRMGQRCSTVQQPV